MTELHERPATGTLRAPEAGATPTIRLRPGRSSSPASPVQRGFRRHFLDRKDPFEASGRMLNRFTFSGSYDLDGTPPQAVTNEIRQRLQQQLADGNLANASLEVIDFDDASMTHEPSRRFFVTHTTTRRKTFVTVNTYIRPYGDHLYYSLRSYVLPRLNVWKLLLALFITFGVLSLSDNYGSLPLMAAVVGVIIHLRKFMIDVAAGDPVSIALRKQYPGRLNSGTFDDDDMTAFLKTNVSLTLRTIATVLEEHGIDTGGLRTIIHGLEINNVSTGGGSIIGAAIGGIANRVAAEVRT